LELKGKKKADQDGMDEWLRYLSLDMRGGDCGVKGKRNWERGCSTGRHTVLYVYKEEEELIIQGGRDRGKL